MGGQNSKQKDITLMINHPVFQQAKLLMQNDQRKIQINFGCTEKEFKKWVQLQSQNIYPQYIMLPLQWTYLASEFCGDAGIAKIAYDDYPYLLSEQIYNRKGAKSKFEECDLWYILYSLASAKRDVSLYSKKIGDVRPQNIFINTKGQCKVTSTSSWPGSLNNFINTIGGQITYLAPQEIKIIDSLKNQQIDEQAAEIFSIGFTILSAATTSDLSYIYGPKGKSFDYNGAQVKTNQLVNNNLYSQILKATILNMCQFDPNNRVSSKQLYEWIQNYKGKIKAKANFVVDQAPMKLHNQVKNLKKALGLVGLSMNLPIKSQFSQNLMSTNIIQSQVKLHDRVQISSPYKQNNRNQLQQKNEPIKSQKKDLQLFSPLK